MESISFDDLIGKIILIGFTYYTHDNVFIEQRQYWGTVIESNEDGIRVKQKNGEVIDLPPDLRSTEVAPPGEYRLRSTGEIIIDPDFLTTWNIKRPPEE